MRNILRRLRLMKVIVRPMCRFLIGHHDTAMVYFSHGPIDKKPRATTYEQVYGSSAWNIHANRRK